MFDDILKKESALWSAGIATLATCLISITTILAHLQNYTRPSFQKRIVRVLLTAPIFSILAYCAILFHSHHLYFNTLSDFYEAYVLFQFFSLLTAYLGGENAVSALLDTKDKLHPKVPCCFCPIIDLNRKFFVRCKRCILQYVWVTPIIASLGLVLGLPFIDMYQEGQWTATSPFLYMSVAKTVSTMLAMFHLVQFYRVFADELEPHRPLGKFACIKVILFLSFWMKIVFSILIFTDVLKDDGVTSFLEDFFVCFEMLIISIVHSRIYGPEEFIRNQPTGTEEGWNLGTKEDVSVWDAFADVVQPNDFWEDSLHSFTRRGESERAFENFLILPETEREEQIAKSGWVCVDLPSPEVGCRVVEKRYLVLLQNGDIFVADNDPWESYNKRKDLVSNQLEFADDDDDLLHHEEEERSKIRSIRWVQLPKVTAINLLNSTPLAPIAENSPFKVASPSLSENSSEEYFDRSSLARSFPVGEEKKEEEIQGEKEVEIEMGSVGQRGEEKEEEGEEDEAKEGAVLELWQRNQIARADYISLSLRGSKKGLGVWARGGERTKELY